MSSIHHTINSTVRLVILGGFVYAFYWAYGIYQSGGPARAELDKAQVELSSAHETIRKQNETLTGQQEQIGQLVRNLEQQTRRADQLDTAMRLLKVNHRVAELSVLDQQPVDTPAEYVTKIRFREIDDYGASVGEPHDFEIQGDVLYVDYWVVKFEDTYVEQADLEKGTSICLFRRIFGERQEPKDGYVLDQVGTRPAAYGEGNQVSPFEQQIWDDFWNIASDPDRAESLGIRAAHGEAVSTRLRPGKQYRVLLRASGGLSISPAQF